MKDDIEKSLLELVYKFVQDCLATNPVIILGSGHSATLGIPDVHQLGEYLLTNVTPLIGKEDENIWKKFECVLKQKHLEAALHEVQLGPQITKHLVGKTWEFIYSADKKALYRIIKSFSEVSPLVRLYDYLFRSTHQRLSLITTNYDHIAEYAADVAGYAWTTGFDYGYIGQRCVKQPVTICKYQTPFRMVDIWKVHGSIKWFRGGDGRVYNFPSMDTLPEGFMPAIVTPGINKYKETHEEPFRSIMAGADMALDTGESFFCVGYGFNDDHIQPKLLEKCRRHNKNIVILSKNLTDAAKKVLLDGGCKHFLAFEETSEGTRMFNCEHRGGVVMKDLNLWSLGTLLDRVV
jgi:hypothetical protein